MRSIVRRITRSIRSRPGHCRRNSLRPFYNPKTPPSSSAAARLRPVRERGAARRGPHGRSPPKTYSADDDPLLVSCAALGKSHVSDTRDRIKGDSKRRTAVRKAVAIVLAAAASLPIMARAQNITDAEIAAAIRAGQAKKFGDLLSTCFATPSFGDLFKEAEPAGGVKADGNYDVTVSTNAGRIAFLAADA